MNNPHYSDKNSYDCSYQGHSCTLFKINDRTEEHGKNTNDDTEHTQGKQLVFIVEPQCLCEFIVFDIGIAVQICQEGNDRELVVANQKQSYDTDDKTYC